MFSKSAQYYDEIYASIDKDYAAEARKAHKIIREYKQSKGKSLLDVACGTGFHAGLLGKYYQVEGLDLDPEMLAVAKKKHPKIRFHPGDMTDFDLKRQFDWICKNKVTFAKSDQEHGETSRSGRRSIDRAVVHAETMASRANIHDTG
jgi:ubiquinone/menaquinone biosynthesis C-methylase UbiE